MALIYITGNSGAGKSSARKALQERGYEAYDTDENGISSWYHKDTGQSAKRPAKETDRTSDWYEKHDWKMNRQKVEEMATQSWGKVVFLCGAASNAFDMFDLFQEVIYLSVNEATLQKRLSSRVNNDFGKTPDELNNILGWHKWMEDSYKDKGATLIDASQPLQRVVDDILSLLSLE